MRDDWRNRVDARNPANVPREVRDARWVWAPTEPATRRQIETLQRHFERAGAEPQSVALLFGDGFAGLDGLSKWAASWAISELHEFARWRDERELKHGMGVILRERM